MGIHKQAAEILPIMPDMQNQQDQPSEFLTSPETCSKCGKPAIVYEGGLCGDCRWKVERDEAIKRKNYEINSKRKQAMMEMIGEGSVSRFTFDTFQPYDEVSKKAFEMCKSFQPSIHNLYLCGMPGTGKTHLACAMAMKAFDAEKTVHFFPSGPSLSRYTRGLDGPEEDRRIDELARVDVLVINELGIGRDTEYSIGTAVEVIDRRIMRGKNGIVITSNFHPVDLAKKMDDARLESRFTGLCKIIETGKMDFRKQFRKG